MLFTSAATIRELLGSTSNGDKGKILIRKWKEGSKE
jgi:hypothetical protein